MLEAGDVVSISGPRSVLVEQVERVAPEVDDRELLDMPVEAVDVFVRSSEHGGKTLRELAEQPFARGIYLRKITRNLVEIPVLPETEILRGDILRIGGSSRHVEAAVAALGHADRPVEETDLAVVGAGIADRRSGRRAQPTAGAASRSACRPRAARCSPACCSAICARFIRPSATSPGRRSG